MGVTTVHCAAALSVSGHRLIEYINPQQPRPELERSRSLLLLHIDAVARGLVELQNKGSATAPEEIQKKWRPLYSVLDDAVLRVYFAADISPDLRQRKEHPLDDVARQRFFRDALPVLEKVLSFGGQSNTGILLAPTAQHYMQLLNGVLRYDPPLVLRLAAEVVASSKRFNYNLDRMALDEVVKLVESILADYQADVQDEASVKHLLSLLDAFVEAGWPQALTLVWRLDEVYR